MRTYVAAFVVDVVVLFELKKLVGRAIARCDGTELREFIAWRRAAYAHLRDAEPIRLDPEKLSTALSQISSLGRSEVAGEPETRELLKAARMTSKRSRNVCRQAFVSLLQGADRLRQFVAWNAPEIVS